MISKTYHLKWIQTILLLPLFLISHFCVAQSVQDIFTTPSWEVSSLTGDELTRYGIIQSNHPDSNIIPIQIENLANIQLEGELLLSIDGEDCGSSLFKAKHTEYVSESDYLWYAELESIDTCSCLYGYLLIRSTGGEKFGMIKMENTLYRIEDLTNGKNVLTRKVFTSENPDRCGEGLITPPAANEVNDLYQNETVSDRSGGNCDITVLMLYTENLELDLGSIGNHANTEIDRLNMAFLNSGISQNGAKVFLQNKKTIDIDETGKKLTEVYVELRNQLEDNTSPAYMSRESVGADIVMLMVDYSLLIPESGVVGMGLPPAGLAGPNGYFAVVAGNDHEGTFEHEFGHLLGCAHEPCDAIGFNENRCCTVAGTPSGTGGECSGPYAISARGHYWEYERCRGIFQKARTYRRNTLMHNFESNEVLHFSNPHILLDDNKTGVIGDRHNSLAIKNNACTLANYKSASFVELTAAINGDNLVCENSTTSVSAFVGGPPGPYQFEWYQSTNPTNYGTVKGTSTNFTIDPFGYPSGNTIFIKLVATAPSSNQSVNAYFQLDVLPANHQDCTQFGPPNGGGKAKIGVYPNPSSNVVDFKVAMEYGKKAKLDLISATGQHKQVIADRYFEKGEHTLSLDVSTYENGLYFVRYWDGNKVLSHKFLVQKN